MLLRSSFSITTENNGLQTMENKEVSSEINLKSDIKLSGRI